MALSFFARYASRPHGQDQLAQGSTHGKLVNASVFHMTADTERTGAGIFFYADGGIPLRAVIDDVRNV